MDIALATVTVISLTMAFAMGIVTCRLIREERRRADARVPMLMADLAADGDNARTVAPPVRTAEPAPPRRRVAPATPVARPARSAGTVALRPFLASVAAAVVVLAAVSFTMLSERSRGPDPGASTPEPVELLSLAHAKEGDYLAITGSIRNPSDGIERGQLSVTAIVFDRDGTVVGTGQTPLPVAVLPPGSETPFTISLPDADRINRYRISFRQGQTSVPHIDRRRPNGQARSGVPAPTGGQP